jgi:peptide chain release factor 2
LEKELEKRIRALELKIKKEEFRTFLSGKYDQNSALLFLQAGAGGEDAQDWTAMLLRMYQKYCQKQGWEAKILEQTFGEGIGPEGRVGIKSATLEIKGLYAYGFLKGESGVHRLVRMSPFSAKKMRHTSFALVEVLPILEKDLERELKISSQDLKIEFYRASGPGGQYVNRRETAVRITHLPTGIVVSCQSERTQGQNREIALRMLYSKLYQLKEKEKQAELAALQKKPRAIAWGNQIRSYILHPYKLVKDLRTGVQSLDPQTVLDGELDQFILAQLYQR